MTAIQQSYASIILPDARALDAAQYQANVLTALDRFDPVDGGTAALSDSGTLALGGSYCIGIEAHEQSDYGPKVVFRMMRHNDAPSGRARRMAMILRHIVRTALVQSEADYVEWMDETVVLTREEFLEAVSEDNRTVLHSETVVEDEMMIIGDDGQFHPVDADLGKLFSNLPMPSANPHELPSLLADTEASASRRMKIAAWAVTGVVASLSVPVAAGLMVMNAGRGADFRLATQMLALTGLGTVLYANGMMPLL